MAVEAAEAAEGTLEGTHARQLGNGRVRLKKTNVARCVVDAAGRQAQFSGVSSSRDTVVGICCMLLNF